MAADSVCFGTSKHGRLLHGVELPYAGANFIAYGHIPRLAGRTYVHSRVREIFIDAYAKLAKTLPGKKFKYAESGNEEGGPFKPHKTHQNGLSIDFMVPVLDSKNHSVYFDTTAFNRYGYDVEFDKNGRHGNLRIDFDALAAHMVALDKAAKEHGAKLWRILFAPDLQPRLYATRYGDYLKQHILIPSKRSWVRHDEHYHVDFAIPCRPLR